MFICRQESNFIANAFLEILQRYTNFLFWVLWACLVTHTQMIVSLCRRLPCLSACQNILHHSLFFRYYILMNPKIRLDDSILAHNSRTRILSRMELVVKYQQQYQFLFFPLNYPGKKGCKFLHIPIVYHRIVPKVRKN